VIALPGFDCPVKFVVQRLVLLGVALMVVQSSFSGYADAADYVVDTGRSEFVVRLFKGGIGAAVAHNHVIRATEYKGEGSFDPENPTAARIRVEVRADSLVADEPDVRTRYGLTKRISKSDRRKIQATMLSAEQMDVNRYPSIEFRSTRIEEQSEGRYIVTGDLSIHGVTQPVTFPATVEKEDDGVRGRATIRFKQSDFGIKPYSAMFGAVRNRDEAVLYVDVIVVSKP
jgi:polyisoprenoid-binding protein YceI